MKNFCPKCDNLSEVTVKLFDEVYSVRGDKIDISAEVAFVMFAERKFFPKNSMGKI
jgi:hypothetical protein